MLVCDHTRPDERVSLFSCANGEEGISPCTLPWFLWFGSEQKQEIIILSAVIALCAAGETLQIMRSFSEGEKKKLRAVKETM